MNRRDFLKRMAMLGLALPSTRLIFDMGANLHKYPQHEFMAMDFGAEKPFLIRVKASNMMGMVAEFTVDGTSKKASQLLPGRDVRIVHPDVSSIPNEFTIETIQLVMRDPKTIGVIDWNDYDR